MNQDRVIWRLTGEELGSCNCDWGCPCQFNARPTHQRCEGMGVCHVSKGHFGPLELNDLKFAFLVSFLGAMHEGNGTLQVVIDERASAAQREALAEIIRGTHGGAIFEIFSAVCPNKLDVIFAPILFESDREARQAKFRVGEICESSIEPIKNPITGEEHRARINLPFGFEFQTAEAANAVRWWMKGQPPLLADHQQTYAQLNPFDWSNL